MNTVSSNSSRLSFTRGYTLLFAVLTAALVLGVAVFILSISTKQYELSASSRNSIYSFYAADSVIECAAAAYADLNGGTIASTTGATITCGVTSSNSPQTVTIGPFSTPASAGYPSFLHEGANHIYQSSTMNFSLGSGTCAALTIYDGFDVSNNHYMVFDARGYNHCISGTADTSNPSTVERALRLTKKG